MIKWLKINERTFLRTDVRMLPINYRHTFKCINFYTINQYFINVLYINLYF